LQVGSLGTKGAAFQLAFQHLLIVTVTPMTPNVNVPFSNPRGPAGQCRATVRLSTKCDEGR